MRLLRKVRLLALNGRDCERRVHNRGDREYYPQENAGGIRADSVVREQEVKPKAEQRTYNEGDDLEGPTHSRVEPNYVVRQETTDQYQGGGCKRNIECDLNPVASGLLIGPVEQEHSEPKEAQDSSQRGDAEYKGDNLVGVLLPGGSGRCGPCGEREGSSFRRAHAADAGKEEVLLLLP